MPCALCGSDAQLRQSHIVPEFVHRPVYDHLHRTLLITHESPTLVIQKGVRQQLLCDSCEGVLQRYEHYFAGLWFKERPAPEHIHDKYSILRGLDYSKFKLFLLSIIWRASVSTRPEFAAMTLGPHAEVMRQMILDGNPGAEHDYPVMCGLIIGPDDELWDDVVMAPMTIRVARHNAARMVFGGASWTILTSSHPAPELEPLCLKSDGTVVTPVVGWEEYAGVSGIAEAARNAPDPHLR